MAKKRDTGKGVPYTPADRAAIVRAVKAAPVDGTAKLDVTAKVEWAGHTMPKNEGKRRTRLELPGGAVERLKAAAEEAERRHQRAADAQPTKENVQHWHAQLRRLVESPVRGSKAADKVGLDVKERTLKRWLSDPDYPVRKGYRDKIAAAYQELRHWNVNEARSSAERADKAVADALTEELRAEHHVTIRLRDIEDFRFE